MNDDRSQLSTQGTGSPIIVIPGARWQTGLIILALTMSLLSLYVVVTRTNDAEREARLAQYYATDLKVWLGTQGLKPPPEPWNKKEKR